MRQTRSVMALLILVCIATARGRAELAGRFTYYSYVQSEQLRVCAKSQDMGCQDSFDKLARVAARLDGEEKVAELLENAGEAERALELRRRILADAIILDFSLDIVIAFYRQEQGMSAAPNL